MTIKQKEHYVIRRVEAMQLRYNQKITTTIDSNRNINELRKASRKVLNQHLNYLERMVATMPDSFVVNQGPVRTDSLGKWTMLVKIDTVMYIKNKNKIKFIRENNLTIPHIRFIEDK
jgi:hypothetical protein